MSETERLFDAFIKNAEAYTIKKGDTLEKVTQQHPTAISDKLLVQDLIMANPGINPTKLQIGQTIIVPTGAMLEQIRVDRQAPRASGDDPLTAQIDAAFTAAASANGVPEGILRGMAQVESGGDVCAQSASAGAQGLMQLMPRIQAAYGVADPFDPISSIWGAAAHLAQMVVAAKQITKYLPDSNVIRIALTMYNLGESAYRECVRTGRKLPTEAAEYADKVLAAAGSRPKYHCNKSIV